ncbi:MAG: hypothetical protein DRP88_00635 [Candidatus Neomarinimicrobiota bacterium]|nr:MAG: hypothetical protein DRP88_00635 [Candidatus Neomarinimicrobiota bacterium]
MSVEINYKSNLLCNLNFRREKEDTEGYLMFLSFSCTTCIKVFLRISYPGAIEFTLPLIVIVEAFIPVKNCVLQTLSSYR